MEDSSHEQVVDQPTTESKISRRDMAKLLGTVTALSASLGVTFVTSAVTAAPGAQLKLKFFKQSPNGDPARSQLLCTIDVSPADQRTLASTEGPVELRFVQEYIKIDIANRPAAREVTVSSQTIPKAAWLKIKVDG
jgi:hypothetical protein